MSVQKINLEFIVTSPNGAEIMVEFVAGAADIPLYRARAMLKRNNIEKPTREQAIELITKRSPSACILLADMYRDKDKKHETLWKNLEAVNERMDMLEERTKTAEKHTTKAVMKNTAPRGRPSKLPNLKPSCFGNSVYLRELAAWAGVDEAFLKAQIESSELLQEETEYFDDGSGSPTLTVKGANAVAKALDLEKAE